jgi:hypothetical protein
LLGVAHIPAPNVDLELTPEKYDVTFFGFPERALG